MPFSWQNYELQCQRVFFCNVRLNNEPSQVVHEILIHGGPTIICDELTLTEASFC